MHLVRRQYIYMNISNVITLQILPTKKKILHEEKPTRKKNRFHDLYFTHRKSFKGEIQAN